MGRGILRGAGGDENLKSNFIWPNHLLVILKDHPLKQINFIFDKTINTKQILSKQLM